MKFASILFVAMAAGVAMAKDLPAKPEDLVPGMEINLPNGGHRVVIKEVKDPHRLHRSLKEYQVYTDKNSFYSAIGGTADYTIDFSAHAIGDEWETKKLCLKDAQGNSPLALQQKGSWNPPFGKQHFNRVGVYNSRVSKGPKAEIVMSDPMYVDMPLSGPHSAWGAYFGTTQEGQGLNFEMDMLEDAGVVQFFPQQYSFWGVVLSGGHYIEDFTFKTKKKSGTYEHFLMDDIVGKYKAGQPAGTCGVFAAPAPAPAPAPASASGDPHITTWGGEKFDFNGGCDLVLLENPGFANGLGLNIHIRTSIRTWWSYIESAIVQIGDNTLQVTGGSGTYSFNGAAASELADGDMALGDFAVNFKRINDHQTSVRIDLVGDAIGVQTFKDFIRVIFKDNKKTHFVGSHGLLGAYPDGKKIGRDGKTVFEDTNQFGQEWMVKPTDKILFPDVDAASLPLTCVMPSEDNKKESMRRRLGEAAISTEEAALACARVAEVDRDACIFDVLATNDKDLAGSY